MPNNRLSAERWNRLEANIARRVGEIRERVLDGLMADGHPPFTSPVTEREELDNLLALKQAGDPAFWFNPEAPARLEHLLRRLGPPPTVGLAGPAGRGGPPVGLAGPSGREGT